MSMRVPVLDRQAGVLRRAVQAAGAGASLLILAVALFAAVEPETRQRVPSQRLRVLLQQSRATDAGEARRACDELKRLGLSDVQIRWGQRMADPAAPTRLRLVGELDAGEDFQARLLDELTRDADARVASAALEALSNRSAPTATSATTILLVQNSVAAPADEPLPDSALSELPESQSPLLTTLDDGPSVFEARDGAEPLFPIDDAPSDGEIGDGVTGDEIEPPVLRRPLESTPFGPLPPDDAIEPWITYDADAPLGFTGKSGIAPREGQETAHFVPIEDRWRLGFPAWDRYGKGHPRGDDYPYVEGHWWDPYNQNVLKGDYPIIGQHTFLNITGTWQTLVEARALPTPVTPPESTADGNPNDFFGNPNQFFTATNLRLSFDLVHGNAAFKPADWRIRVTPIFNGNYLDVNELGVVNPDVRRGTTRFREDFALEEYFLEYKLADLGPDYDFMSVRAGSQPFVSDFKGFVFADVNRAVRLFGTRFSNRDQFNLLFFDQTEKNTNSFLNTFDDRHQNTVIANYYREDFIFPGYTAQASFHYNQDGPSIKYDKNGFLVRPDPVGVARQHRVEAYYFGLAGDGHIGRINVNNTFYWVTGHDNLNPIAGQPVNINARMAAIEASYDRDWIRFRSSFFWASGDDKPLDGNAKGFDTIFDDPNFAGGQFSFWQRQAVKLLGVNLVQRNSLVPNLRSSKFQGQSNFVNPGLYLANAGFDLELTPKARLVNNFNYLWFEETAVLEQMTFQSNISRRIGADLSTGIEYRPFLNNNVLIIAGVAGLLPGNGFRDLYNPITGRVNALYSTFFDVAVTY